MTNQPAGLTGRRWLVRAAKGPAVVGLSARGGGTMRVSGSVAWAGHLADVLEALSGVWGKRWTTPPLRIAGKEIWEIAKVEDVAGGLMALQRAGFRVEGW